MYRITHGRHQTQIARKSARQRIAAAPPTNMRRKMAKKRCASTASGISDSAFTIPRRSQSRKKKRFVNPEEVSNVSQPAAIQTRLGSAVTSANPAALARAAIGDVGRAGHHSTRNAGYRSRIVNLTQTAAA